MSTRRPIHVVETGNVAHNARNTQFDCCVGRLYDWDNGNYKPIDPLGWELGSWPAAKLAPCRAHFAMGLADRS